MKMPRLACVAIACAAVGVAYGRTVDVNYTLTQDEDWTSDGSVMVSATVDLNGHNLTVAGLSAYCITNKTGVVEGYSDLEFLDTSGGQRVLTDFVPTDSDVVYMGMKFHEGNSNNQFLWCDRSDKAVSTLSCGRVSGKFRFDRRNKTTMSGTQYTAENGVYYDIVADYSTGTCAVNGWSAGTMSDTASFTPPTNLVLFASFEIKSRAMVNWGNPADLRFYYLIVRRSGSVVAHFVPVMRQSDSMIGVYDRVAGKFYGNSGTGDFTAGQGGEITNSASGAPAELRLDIPGGEWQELEYIEATGSECIQTAFWPVGTDRVEMKVNFTATNVNQCLFCTRKTQDSRSFTLLAVNREGVAGKSFRFDYANTQSFGNQIPVNEDLEIRIDGNARTENIGLVGNTFANSETPTIVRPFLLFASTADNVATSNFARVKCYYFRVFDKDDNLKCDMVPARNVLGVYGMYDRVSSNFYGSCRTEFTAHGPAVQKVDHIFNNAVAFSGNIKVVKKGKGVYVASMSGQTYSGGTVIMDGLVQCGTSGSNKPFGQEGSAITVLPGGAIDMNGKLNYGAYPFTLAGGMITNSVDQAQTYNSTCIADVTLTADSSFVAGGRYALSQKTNAVWSARLDLAGHKLTIMALKAFYFRGVEAVSAGTIELHGSRLIEFIGNDSDLQKVSMVVTDGGQLRVDNGRVIKLGNYVSDAEAKDDLADYGGKLELYGTFKPNTDYFHGLELQDGATIDVSGRTTPMPLQSRIGTNCVDNAKNVTFATNATVYVDCGDRNILSREPILSWTPETCPVNLDTLTFLGTIEDKSVRLEKRGNGVYRPTHFTIYFR